MKWLLAVACVSLVGCRCGDRVDRLYGEGRFIESVQVTVDERGEATLDFGEVAFGEALELSVSVRNEGGGPLEMLRVDGLDAPFTAVDTLPLVLGGSQTHALTFRFAPPFADEELHTAAYAKTLELVLGEDDVPGKLRLHLKGRARVGDDCVALAPGVVDFGGVPLACGVRHAVALVNACQDSLRVSDVSVEPAGNFAAELAIPAGGLVLPPMQILQIPVRFSAADAGHFESLLRVSYERDGRGETARRTILKASTVGRAEQTDTFIVQSAIDVLVMAKDRVVAAQQGWFEVVETVMEQFSDAGVDYHLGFARITWDWDSECFRFPDCTTNLSDYRTGELVAPDGGGPLFVTATTPDRQRVVRESFENSLFRQQRLGSTGSICFEAARRALTPPLSTTTNLGFVRADVPLVVLCFSFAGETSNTVKYDQTGWFHWPPVTFYADALIAARGARHLVSVNAATAVETSPPECWLAGPAGRERYVEMAALTNGVVVDACAPDWRVLFDDLNAKRQVSARKFVLKSARDVTLPMTVRVGSRELTNSEWSYDGGVLALAELPPAGTAVDATYTPQCD